MAAPVPLPRPRWLRATIALALILGAVWWWQRDDSNRTGPSPAAARVRPGFPSSMTFADGKWQRRRRGLGPIAVAPPGPGLVRVSGTVVDANAGTPVPDVEVVFADGTSEASATTDLAGRYLIDVPVGQYRPFVRADGILSVGRVMFDRLPTRPRPDQIAASRLEIAPALVVSRDLGGVDLEVVRSGVVRGRVVDPTGKPVAGAMVRASGEDRRTLRPVLGTDSAETALDGSFQLELAAASYVLEAFHDDYGASQVTGAIEVEAGARADVDITMIAGCVITGRVVRRGGEPAGDGAIERAWSTDAADSFFPAGDFDDEGNFRWTTAEVGEVVLRAWPWKATHSEPRRFTCTDGARFANVVFEIPRVEADLGGRIVTATGAPAAYAYLDITGVSAGTMNQQERADGEGRWEVFSLPPGQYQVTAYVEGQGATTTVVTAPGRDHTLRLAGTGTLTGQVKGVTDGSFRLATLMCHQDGHQVVTLAQHLVIVRGGSYRLDGLPACDLTVEASTPSRRRRATVSIASGAIATLDLDLQAPETKTIQGTVRNPDGTPAPGAQATVLRPVDGNDVDLIEEAVADGSGRFTVTARGGDVVILNGATGAGQIQVADDDPATRIVEVTLEGPDDDF